MVMLSAPLFHVAMAIIQLCFAVTVIQFSQRGEFTGGLFYISDEKAFGPRVADTKSELVTNTFILTGFQKLSGHPNPLVALFTADEEIESPAS